MKKIHFMAGLPRAGSTLLSSILSQNPNVHAGSNSPMCGMMFNLERSIIASEQYRAYPKPHVIPSVITGVIQNFYSDIEASVVIDKSREWSVNEYFNVLLRNLPYEPRVLVPVRNVQDILASFINLLHNDKSGKVSFIDQEIKVRNEFNFYRPVDDIRCDHLMRPKGLIDNALYGISNALLKENRKYFHFIEYDDLVNNTEEEIKRIYEFLELESFDHDFTNIKNKTKEDDKVYGLSGLHDVRPTISRREIDTEKILSPYVRNKYADLEFWRTHETAL